MRNLEVSEEEKEDCNDRLMEVVVSENSKMREQTNVNGV
jgi:hypothetical protein